MADTPPGQGNTLQHAPCAYKSVFHRIGSQPSRTSTFFAHPSIHVSLIPKIRRPKPAYFITRMPYPNPLGPSARSQ
ncbi:hypothetical protein DID88_008850 [Monilinia fructigena]|uniref:Uncharacterized protein n=1 Tax=Monilinia fructigena TaxID=38457 RepID=A0A395J7L4_9HELO|nr:hypothetical protein DID88_008850 [Monilinia fructigena]